jgi:hypothetical protein
MKTNHQPATTTTTSPVMTWLIPGILLSIALLFALQIGKVEQGNWQATAGTLQNVGITGALLVLTLVTSLNARRAGNALN